MVLLRMLLLHFRQNWVMVGKVLRVNIFKIMEMNIISTSSVKKTTKSIIKE